MTLVCVLSWGTIPDMQDSSKREGRVAYRVSFLRKPELKEKEAGETGLSADSDCYYNDVNQREERCIPAHVLCKLKISCQHC